MVRGGAALSATRFGALFELLPSLAVAADDIAQLVVLAAGFVEIALAAADQVLELLDAEVLLAWRWFLGWGNGRGCHCRGGLRAVVPEGGVALVVHGSEGLLQGH